MWQTTKIQENVCNIQTLSHILSFYLNCWLLTSVVQTKTTKKKNLSFVIHLARRDRDRTFHSDHHLKKIYSVAWVTVSIKAGVFIMTHRDRCHISNNSWNFFKNEVTTESCGKEVSELKQLENESMARAKFSVRRRYSSLTHQRKFLRRARELQTSRRSIWMFSFVTTQSVCFFSGVKFRPKHWGNVSHLQRLPTCVALVIELVVNLLHNSSPYSTLSAYKSTNTWQWPTEVTIRGKTESVISQWKVKLKAIGL